MPKRPYPRTTLYHLLAAYGDVCGRAAERKRRDDLFPHKLPAMTIGGRNV